MFWPSADLKCGKGPLVVFWDKPSTFSKKIGLPLRHPLSRA